MICTLRDRALALLQRRQISYDHWQFHLLPEWVAESLPPGAAEGFVDFIREHKDYSFAYYDAFGKVCGKPREVAAYVLTELIEELVEERQQES
ncbi:MAG: hypothetical protein FJ147_16620 [Deltaproteobacteria bacterium]|nr:hypothetical protein [Deltaproteobacteria bacterium]